MLPLVASLLLSATTSAPERMPAPAEQCLDARSVTQMRQLTPTLLIVATEQQRYRLDLASACADLAGGAALLANQGWVCGLPREFVQSAGKLCPVGGVTEISTRDYALLARAADQSKDGQLLAPVEVHSKQSLQRGFRGSPDYCFRPSLVRAWAADSDGILVQTSKRHSGGYGSYRLELGSSCPEIAYLPNLSLHSGVGLDLICGTVGDVAVLSSGEPELAGAMTPAPEDGISAEERRFALSSISARRGCAITAVYPVVD